MHKMVEKFGKSWVLISIYPSRLNHIIDWWHCSRLIHTWKIATHNYLPNSNQIFLSLNCDSENWTAKLCLRCIKMDNIQTERLSYGKICGERRLFHDLINNCPGNRQNLKPQGSLCPSPPQFSFQKQLIIILKSSCSKILQNSIGNTHIGFLF